MQCNANKFNAFYKKIVDIKTFLTIRSLTCIKKFYIINIFSFLWTV